MSNFLITNNLDSLQGYQIITIDGQKAHTLRGFYEEMAKGLQFPEYFGFNLDSFDEMLNDLSWLDQEKIAIYITNSELFVEKERNPDKLPTLLDLLDATCEDWKWVEEDDDVKKKDLVVVFSPSERITKLLDSQEISYELR
ncbi:Barstar (barnase inhibitor) [Emticicia oligotrophica DSM 17448]|uniref:Barstar (Barnase inhibitor) n=1 Tax=Emticicia oligotrophica (strain DSM 17448 / CIP 109782 / MTCC 6937 / GPTSA100-15) TaxID=929562 RepID=A0ABN4AMA8_EMTOG|nr:MULTISPECIES: barstar family protein [Emticicia]AFK03461.1 Barstar (barnase inhibitor) [Emticicia oligotrophica DSM 17448]